jgi:hypothetical protein
MPSAVYQKGVAYIYVLADPRFPTPFGGTIRYVGKAANPRRRLEKHCREARNHPRNHRECWLKGLQDDGFMPEMAVIDECPEEEWQDRERYWISSLRSFGCNLLNGTDGGDGLEHPTDEIRAKIGLAVGNAHRGRKKSPEHAAKLRECLARGTAKAATAETRAKMSEAAKRRGMAAATLARMRWWIITSPEGEEFKVFNVSEFAREHKIPRARLARCVATGRRGYTGWQVRRLEEDSQPSPAPKPAPVGKHGQMRLFDEGG